MAVKGRSTPQVLRPPFLPVQHRDQHAGSFQISGAIADLAKEGMQYRSPGPDDDAQ